MMSHKDEEWKEERKGRKREGGWDREKKKKEERKEGKRNSTHFSSYTFGNRNSSNTTRLSDSDHTRNGGVRLAVSGFVNKLRYLRGFTRTSLSANNSDVVFRDCLNNALLLHVNR